MTIPTLIVVIVMMKMTQCGKHITYKNCINGEDQFVKKNVDIRTFNQGKHTIQLGYNLHTKADSSDETTSVMEENIKVDDEQVNFMDRLKTVWKIMENQLPDSSESKKKSIKS